MFFFFSSRRRHTRLQGDWSSDVCSSDLSPPLANDQVKFASYTRDSATGLDYADQRYYANTFGRFMSPDLYQSSGGPTSPQSWNRYAYVAGRSEERRVGKECRLRGSGSRR